MSTQTSNARRFARSLCSSSKHICFFLSLKKKVFCCPKFIKLTGFLKINFEFETESRKSIKINKENRNRKDYETAANEIFSTSKFKNIFSTENSFGLRVSCAFALLTFTTL